jgi:hypothetical protein
MHLVIDQRVKTLTHIGIEFVVDCGDQIGFRPKHRLGRHSLHYADTGDDDAPRAQLVQQSVEENAPVHDAHALGCQPRHHRGASWPA